MPSGDRGRDSDLLDNHLSFVTGLYYFHENYYIGSPVHLGPDYCNVLVRNIRPALLAPCLAGPQALAISSDFNQKTDSYAAYGQATLKMTSRWDVTGGLRYSHDDKTGSVLNVILNPVAAFLAAPDNASLSYSGGRLTYRASTSYRPVEDVMLFATVSSGYKSGGFDSGNGVTLGTNRVFRPETSTNYELGVKSQFLARRLTLNATLFRLDINDLQLRSFNGLSFSVRNAASVRQQGAEFEVSGRPTTNLTLSIAGTYLDSAYTNYPNAPNLPAFTGTQNLTGQRVPFSPKWQGSASANYHKPIGNGYALGLDAHLFGISTLDVGSNSDGNPQGFQKGYALFGSRLSLFGPGEKWEFFGSAENVTDKHYCVGKFGQTGGALFGLNNAATGGTVQRCVLGDPRVIRVGFKYRFGQH